jgi:predicted metal-dependent enzyme (double-stranded beta helix superfamily)
MREMLNELTDCPGLPELVTRLESAVGLVRPEEITQQVKLDLCDVLSRMALRLPAGFRRTRTEGYARRLLHHDPERNYSAVVMTWAPGQCTPLHDHGGLWCVEGVVDGVMEVTQFDLIDVEDGGYRFAERGRVRASVGTAGCLIPPSDYHILGNALEDRASITLHVYGGDLTQCHVFVPRGDGRYERQHRQLSYND